LDSAGRMIRGGFLSPRQRAELMALLRDGHAEQRLVRRANALLLLDDGWSCEKVAKALYLDDDTVRGWRKTYVADGLRGLGRFEGGGSASYLSAEQESRLKAWIGETLPRSANAVGAYIAQEFGVVYESRSALIAMPHRLGLEYGKPEAIGRKLDPEKQKASSKPTRAFSTRSTPTRACRSWTPSFQRTRRVRSAAGRRPKTIEQMYPLLAVIHVFLDNARYHHAQAVERWRFRLHAQASDAQHMLRQPSRVRRDGSHFPPRARPRTLARTSRFGHRQLPRHRSQRFSGSDVNGV
jgi:transposase